MGWLKNLRQGSVFADVEKVNIDWQEVKTVEDSKRILVLMANPYKQPIICNNRDDPEQSNTDES